METADFNVHDFDAGNNAGDAKLSLRFFTKAKQDAELTQAEGRPIFKEVEYIQVMIPGDRNQINIHPVTNQDRARFTKQYEHWKQNKNNDTVVGTPLEAWNILTLSQIEEYRYFGIRTIEQMADLRDDVCGKITGATILKQKAQVFMAILKDEAPMKKVQVELDKRDNELATMRAAIEDQAKLIKKLQKKAAA